MNTPTVHAERFDRADIDMVVFDADDTLWRSEDYFTDAERFFCERVGPYAAEGVDVMAELRRIEIGNVAISGYGVKPYALSMVEAAVHASAGAVPSKLILELVEYAYAMLQHPVELLDGVSDTLDAVRRTHRLGLITKGDLLHQMRKLRASGLTPLFERVRVVEEKDAGTYREVFTEWSVDPQRTVMVGNSIRSDVLPIIELGGYGIHVPYHTTWAHEHVDDHAGGFTALACLAELPAWLAGELTA